MGWLVYLYVSIYSLIYAISLLISPLWGRHLHHITPLFSARQPLCVRLLKQMPQTILIFIFLLL